MTPTPALPQEESTAVYTWNGHLLIADGEPFEMAGRMVQPVISRAHDIPTWPNFTNSRGQYIRYGWVYREELVAIDVTVAQQQALETWQAAMHETNRLIEDGRLADYAAAQALELQAEQAFVQVVAHAQ